MNLPTLTVILEKNPTTGFWRAFVLQSGTRGTNLCSGRPTTEETARNAATRNLRKAGHAGEIKFVSG